MKSFVNNLKSVVLGTEIPAHLDEGGKKVTKSEVAPWFAYRLSYPSKRAIKRQRARDVERMSGKYYAGKDADGRTAKRMLEIMEVRALREVERANGQQPGELLSSLVAAQRIDTHQATPGQILKAAGFGDEAIQTIYETWLATTAAGAAVAK